jgi:hypothetical protein
MKNILKVITVHSSKIMGIWFCRKMTEYGALGSNFYLKSSGKLLPSSKNGSERRRRAQV